MACTEAAIIALLGFMPPKGGEPVVIPRALYEQATRLQRIKAQLCARKHNIKWRVE